MWYKQAEDPNPKLDKIISFAQVNLKPRTSYYVHVPYLHIYNRMLIVLHMNKHWEWLYPWLVNLEFPSCITFTVTNIVIWIFRKGVAQVVEELDKVLAFNNLLISLKQHLNADRFARGVGPVSLVGKNLFLFDSI